MAEFIDKDALLELIKTFIGGAPEVVWDGDTEGYVAFSGIGSLGEVEAGAVAGVRVKLNITANAQHGVDDYRREFDEVEETLDATNIGVRHVTLSLVIESPSVLTMAVIERLRNKFNSRGGARLLRELDLAVRSVGDARQIRTAEWGNGTLDATIMEVLLTFVSESPDTIGEAADKGNWIEAVRGTNPADTVTFDEIE